MADLLAFTVGAKLRATMEHETGVLMKPDTAAILATAALQAIEAAGYRVVPVEATRKMRLAGEKEMMARHTNLDCFRDPYVDSTYAAMLSAAPRVGEGV